MVDGSAQLSTTPSPGTVGSSGLSYVSAARAGAAATACTSSALNKSSAERRRRRIRDGIGRRRSASVLEGRVASPTRQAARACVERAARVKWGFTSDESWHREGERRSPQMTVQYDNPPGLG